MKHIMGHKVWECIVMGPGQKFLTRVGSGQPFIVWV